MAENDFERSEKPTARRIEKAREEGQLPRSADLSAAAVLLAAGGALQVAGGRLGGELLRLMRSGLEIEREQALDPALATDALHSAALHGALACAPVLAMTLAAALVAPVALGGWNLSFKVLAPDFTRLNPVAGFGRMFSARGAVELLKALAKFGVVASVAAWLLWREVGELLGLGAESTNAAIGHSVRLTGHALLLLGGSLGLIAAVDVPWQLFQHSKRLRMTREQIREEMKESEGSPEMKGRIRSLQRELARRRMMHEVPKADVVVVNPTHYAVALRYDERRMRAPLVVAKGADLIAARIRELATEHGVPVLQAPPLARALHRHVEIGAEVPASLYVAVAQVLTWVYQLKTARQSGAPEPSPPEIDPGVETEAAPPRQ